MYGTSNYPDKVIQAAAPDALRLKMSGNANLPKGGSLHPIADDLNLIEIVAAFNPKERTDHNAQNAARISGGMASPGFGMAITAAAQTEFQSGYDAAAEHLAGVRVVDAPDFKPYKLNMTDGGLTLELLPENQPLGIEVQKVPNGEFIVLQDFAKGGLMTRAEVINDDLSILADTARATGVTSARLHSDLIAAKLESNPTLKDGSPTFIQGQNDFAGQVLSIATLGAAMAALRNQQSPSGAVAGNKAAVLFVAGDIEAVAYSILKDSGMALKIVCLPGLPDGRWYLSASPDVSPTVIAARLKNPGTSFLHAAWHSKFDSDALRIEFAMTTAAVIVSRVGIVRAGGVAPAPEA